MSYVPKYIIKRMLPKDCVTKTDAGIEIKFLNVLSPIAIEEIPDNALDYLEIKVNGKDYGNDVKAGIKIKFEGEEATVDNLKSFIGRTIPMGGALNISVPITDLNKGDSYEFEITIKTDNPFNIKAKRTVQ